MIPISSGAKFANASMLRLHVYVVGYAPEGESILTIIAEGSKPLYTILTDCYEKEIKDQNNKKYSFSKIQQILDEWGEPPINVFIWTHPHEDHSVGIPQLLSKYDPQHKAFIFLPDNLVGFRDHPEVKQRAKDAHDWINKYYEKSRKIIYIGCHLLCPIYEIPIVISSANPDLFSNIEFKLNFFCPPQIPVAHQADLSAFNLNVASIAYVLSISGIDIFMGGDMNSKVLEDVSDRVFNHLNLIKIPHHASSEVRDLIPKLKRNKCECVNSVTTIYKKGKDPKPEILEEYKQLPSIVHCTGPESTYTGPDVFGLVEYRYNLFTSRLDDCIPMGHSYMVK